MAGVVLRSAGCRRSSRGGRPFWGRSARRRVSLFFDEVGGVENLVRDARNYGASWGRRDLQPRRATCPAVEPAAGRRRYWSRPTKIAPRATAPHAWATGSLADPAPGTAYVARCPWWSGFDLFADRRRSVAAIRPAPPVAQVGGETRALPPGLGGRRPGRRGRRAEFGRAAAPIRMVCRRRAPVGDSRRGGRRRRAGWRGGGAVGLLRPPTELGLGSGEVPPAGRSGHGASPVSAFSAPVETRRRRGGGHDAARQWSGPSSWLPQVGHRGAAADGETEMGKLAQAGGVKPPLGAWSVPMAIAIEYPRPGGSGPDPRAPATGRAPRDKSADSNEDIQRVARYHAPRRCCGGHRA